MGKLKKLGIGFIIVVLILLVVDNVKYWGLSEGQVEYTKMIVELCQSNPKADCEWIEERTIDNFREDNKNS